MATNQNGSSERQCRRLSKAVKATSPRPVHDGVGRGSTSKISRRAFVARSAGTALVLGGLSNVLVSKRAASQTGSGTVVVMAWENYVHAEIQKRFHEATGITVRGIPADSDQDMFTKLKAGGGEQYDIVFANAGFCPFYHEAGLIEPIDLTQIPAAKNLWPIFKTDTSFPYVVAPNQTLLYPSMWASFGICWNIDRFQVPPPYSWKSLWDAPKGKVILQGAGDDFLSLAGLALGVPRSEIYSMTGPTLEKAAEYLRQLKPFQISASSDLVTADAIRTGKAVVGQATSLGLAYRINEKAGKHVADIQLPKEGALGWVDGPQLVKDAKNRDNALKFIDFLMGDPAMQDWLWQYNVFGMASQTTSERIMKSGAQLNAPVYEALGGMKPEIAKSMVFQGPSRNPKEWAAAYDKVLAD
ncbi:MAG TPA: PotD/PotF family extracellular solute-binding protein [Nitrospira sp.]|nr:PotD/PotF family extracellular solute-binding protein [Nitrospira sp.]